MFDLAGIRKQERICRESGDPAGLSASLGNQANVLDDRGDPDGAMALYEEVERICREIGEPGSLQRALGNQAVILNARDELEGAMARLTEGEHICREIGDPEGLALSLVRQASILGLAMGRPQEARTMAEEAYRLASQHGLTDLAKQTQAILQMMRR